MVMLIVPVVCTKYGFLVPLINYLNMQEEDSQFPSWLGWASEERPVELELVMGPGYLQDIAVFKGVLEFLPLYPQVLTIPPCHSSHRIIKNKELPTDCLFQQFQFLVVGPNVALNELHFPVWNYNLIDRH